MVRSRIHSIVPRGSGVEVVHGVLRDHIPHYYLDRYSPRLEYFPPILARYRNPRASLLHLPADYAFLLSPRAVPVVITFHNYVLDKSLRKYSSGIQNIHYRLDLRWLTARALDRADFVTAVSRFTAKLIASDTGTTKEIRVIPNGVDERRFVPVKRGLGEHKRVRVLFSGNLTRRKGAQWLHPIIERLPDTIEILYTQGLRAGGGVHEHPRLHCVGAVPHRKMPELYGAVDMVLSCTVREGMPLSILEAMACGLPVVATDCSSLPELIDDGRGGFLCPVGDVDSFAQKIRLLAADRALRREMGEYNRGRVERDFALDGMVSSYKYLFEDILSSAG